MGNNYHSRNTYSYIDTDIIILQNRNIIKVAYSVSCYKTNAQDFPPTANAIRLDGERNLIGRRTESDRAADASGGKMLGVMAQRARRDGLSVGGYGISFPLRAALARR